MNDAAMNEIFELWSLPWHALQRRLAINFGAATPATVFGNPQSLVARAAATPASSWLVRALSVTGQAAAQAKR